jgi:hypothetical protein
VRTPRQGTCLMSPFLHPELWRGSYSHGRFEHHFE